jgi:hypothetical protein
MFQTKVVEKIKTHILFSVHIFPKIMLFFETMWKDIVEPDRPHDNTIRRLCFAC